VKVSLNDIERDDDIYPRQRVSHKTIEGYVEALKAGASFPPILVQRISVGGEDGKEVKLICLDGWHRLEAYREYNKLKDVNPIEEVEVIFWKEETLDKKEWLDELRIVSAERNIRHGLRLGDVKFFLRRLAETSPRALERGFWKEVAKRLDLTPRYISNCISDILSRKRMTRDALIYKLYLLGWTQREIGELLGIARSTVAENVGKWNKFYFPTLLSDFYDKGKSIDEIAEYYGLDITLTWGIILQGKDDLERFRLFGKPEYQDHAPKIYNVWNFSKCDPRLGKEYPGRIPGQIVLNLLYYYTRQGDLVVDPMAGGGSTVDACLVMGRRCRAYDIKPIRRDIVKWDLYDGFPRRAKGCDFIFLDPPYWNLLKGFYVEESVSEVSLEEWLSFMEKVIKDSYNTVREGGHVALIVEAMDEGGTKEFHDLPYMCMKFFEETGFKEVQRISVPLTTQVKSHHDVGFAKERKIILDINRDLIVYQRV